MANAYKLRSKRLTHDRILQSRDSGTGDVGRDLCFAHVTHTYKFPDKIDLDALMSIRNIWIDAPLAKRKKQERLLAFSGCASAKGITFRPCHVFRQKCAKRALSARSLLQVQACWSSPHHGRSVEMCELSILSILSLLLH
jgi:hypothetical protein